MKLSELSNIQTGIFIKPFEQGNLLYLQSKHFDEKGNLIQSTQPNAWISNNQERHLLKNGDILFAAKGPKNFATLYQDMGTRAVASTSFFVLRIKHNIISPQYLTWFLNCPRTQTILKNQAVGTSIPSISMEVLKNLEIKVPSLQTQNAILEITKLRLREKKLNKKIKTLRDSIIDHQLSKVLNNV